MNKISHSSFGSPSFLQVARGLVALHQLIREGKDDSPEADAIRDALDGPLAALSETERERARWLSEDLYSVGEPPEIGQPIEANLSAQEQLAGVLEARQAGQWDRALALLRLGKANIAPSLLSRLRGSVWQEAGVLDIAAVFFAHAAEGGPTNDS